MRAARPGVAGPWDELLMLLVDADLHGPAVLAIHRLLAGLDGEAVLAGLELTEADLRPFRVGRDGDKAEAPGAEPLAEWEQELLASATAIALAPATSPATVSKRASRFRRRTRMRAARP